MCARSTKAQPNSAGSRSILEGASQIWRVDRMAQTQKSHDEREGALQTLIRWLMYFDGHEHVRPHKRKGFWYLIRRVPPGGHFGRSVGIVRPEPYATRKTTARPGNSLNEIKMLDC